MLDGIAGYDMRTMHPHEMGRVQILFKSSQAQVAGMCAA
jgi:hypothetical protein